MRDIRQTQGYAKYMQLLGWNVFGSKGSFLYVKNLYLFSIAKMQRSKDIDFVKLKKIINNINGLVICYIEPESKKQISEAEKFGFKQLKSSSLPSKTIRFDLSNSYDELLNKMHHKTRYNIGLAKRRGVDVKSGEDIKEFADFWQESARKRNMYFSLKKEIVSIYDAFVENSEILWAVSKGKKVAAVLVLYTNQAGYYLYAASTDLGNKHQAPSLLVWEAIRKSKKRGLKYFDFEGIYDVRFPLKSWKGFSKFKQSFGGEILEFPGTMRKIYWPF